MKASPIVLHYIPYSSGDFLNHTSLKKGSDGIFTSATRVETIVKKKGTLKMHSKTFEQYERLVLRMAFRMAQNGIRFAPATANASATNGDNLTTHLTIGICRLQVSVRVTRVVWYH
jgi:hypothetical protein